MRALCPIEDHALMERDMERIEARATHKLVIEDLLSKGPIEVDGIKYDVKVSVTLKRQGAKGPIEIDSMEISDDLYIVLPPLPEIVKLDSAAFKERQRHAYNRLENALDLRALSFGLASSDWEMENIDE